MIINSVFINKQLIFSLCLFLTACNTPTATVSNHQLFVFGTLVDINIWHPSSKNVQPAVDQISQEFNQMHHQWHAWKPGRLFDINQQLRAGRTAKLNDEEASFIQQSIEQAKLSNHLFNPVIGELIHLWGFHTDDYPLLTPPPSNEDIAYLIQQQLNVNQLSIHELELSSSNPHVWLEFGGIAKGYAIDKAIDILAQHGLENAIVNAGGDLRSVGSKGKTPWRVAIQSPSDWSMVAEIFITGNEAIFTSGNYQRYKEFDGQRYSHIIHPITGLPVGQIVSATVITDKGIDADVAATALVVAGKNWFKTANDMGIEQALVINEQHECYGTESMLARLENLTIDCHIIQ